MSAPPRLARLARIVPSGPGGPAASRTPFVLLVVVLLGSGLLALLFLNASVNQGSFRLSKLEKETEELTDEQQALQQEVDRRSAPDVLERRARELGLVPGGNPAFLAPDGTVRGKPEPAVGERASRGAAREPGARPQSGADREAVEPGAPILPDAPGTGTRGGARSEGATGSWQVPE
ncbi:septum formation initiator family protein [Streptomyces sp. AJS327]|uniref:FtsB family cell division protein n=1 Tax=Streptomyces sp. AJS327 TaxID=2545265 RepID=UPI0021559AC2|nr:septum formation initiator family protein [Streptomyces sp. AJS327]